MKTKRLLSAALVMCMAVSLAGCSDEDSSSSKRNSKNDTSSSEAAVTTADSKDEQTTTTTTTAATTTTAYEPEPEPVVTADYDLDGYEADLAFDFSEGKGWILKDNTLIAVTNKGEELFTLSSFIARTYVYASEIGLFAYLTEAAALVITQTYYLAFLAVYAGWICVAWIRAFLNLSV